MPFKAKRLVSECDWETGGRGRVLCLSPRIQLMSEGRHLCDLVSVNLTHTGVT